MATKVSAAKLASRSGASTVIASGSLDDVITTVATASFSLTTGTTS
jgi:glutamate 5-kinase